MGSPRDVRRLALLALYQLEARRESDPELIRETLDETEALEDEGLVMSDPGSELTLRERDKAFETAKSAYENRSVADEEFGALSSEWRVERMPAMDRAVLRLAHYELTLGASDKPRAVIHEAVELAKQFSTPESPGFVNALLDKVHKRVLARSGAGEGS